jgi:hypothetical protein
VKTLSKANASLIRKIKRLRTQIASDQEKLENLETIVKFSLKDGEYSAPGVRAVLAHESREIPNMVKIKKLKNWQRLMKTSRFRTLRIEVKRA